MVSSFNINNALNYEANRYEVGSRDAAVQRNRSVHPGNHSLTPRSTPGDPASSHERERSPVIAEQGDFRSPRRNTIVTGPNQNSEAPRQPAQNYLSITDDFRRQVEELNRLPRNRFSYEFEAPALSRANSAGEEMSQLLELDISKQKDPLSVELVAWLHAAKQTTLLPMEHFNEEPLSQSFARMLHRKLKPKEMARSNRDEVLKQGAEVIHAIAENQELRGEVFAIAETALASCTDNLAAGFSNVVLHVKNFQRAKDIEKGLIKPDRFNSEMKKMFRLSVLEQEVHKILGQRQTEEPIEAMVQAKVALAEELDLPEGIPKNIEYESASILNEDDIKQIADTVRHSEAKGSSLREFVLSDPQWLTSMKLLHKDNGSLKSIKEDYENNSIWSINPSDTPFNQYNPMLAEIKKDLEEKKIKLFLKLGDIPDPTA